MLLGKSQYYWRATAHIGPLYTRTARRLIVESRWLGRPPAKNDAYLLGHYAVKRGRFLASDDSMGASVH